MGLDLPLASIHLPRVGAQILHLVVYFQADTAVHHPNFPLSFFEVNLVDVEVFFSAALQAAYSL